MQTFYKKLAVGETWTPPTLIGNRSVVIEGPGQGLAFVNGPINIVQTQPPGVDWGVSNPNRVKLFGFTSLATSPSCGTAINIQYPSMGSMHFKVVELEDIDIASYNATDYWSDGVKFENVWFSSIKNVNVRGKVNATPQQLNDFQSTNHGFWFKKCIKILAQDCIATWCKHGVKQFGQNENVTFKDSEFVACIYGVFVNGTVDPIVPIVCNLENVHFNGFGRGFWAKKASQFNISNCVFYRREDDNFGDFVGFMLEDCWNFNVSNIILSDNSVQLADNGVVVSGNSHNGSLLNIRAQNFDTSAWLQVGSRDIDVCNVRGIVNHGTNNKIL